MEQFLAVMQYRDQLEGLPLERQFAKTPYLLTKRCAPVIEQTGARIHRYPSRNANDKLRVAVYARIEDVLNACLEDVG